jgi:hypothetical protein
VAHFGTFSHRRSLAYIVLRRIVRVMLLANFDEGVKIAEEVGNDSGERSIVAGGPDAGLAMDGGWNGDGNVFGHASVPESGGSGLMT